MLKNLLLFVMCILTFLFAHLCEKINLHIVSLHSCSNKMAALTRPDAKQESVCSKDG